MERTRTAVLTQPRAGFAVAAAPDLSRRDVQARLSSAAVLAFFKVMDAWSVRDEVARQLLGGVSNGVYYQWKRGTGKTLDQDKLTRISLVVGIFKALNILYSAALADSWMRRPNMNPIFGGEPPLEYVRKGGIPALQSLRRLLDSRRGGL